MTHHDDEICNTSGHVVGKAVDPVNIQPCRSVAGDLEHRKCRIHSYDRITTLGKIDCEHAGPAPNVHDRAGTQLFCKREVEVMVLSPGAFSVVHRGEPWILCP